MESSKKDNSVTPSAQNAAMEESVLVQEQSDKPVAAVSLLKHHRSNIIDQSTEFINEHLRLFRTIPWFIGGVGVIILIRYSRLPLRRLRAVRDVPESLIRNNGQLSGFVMSTNWNRIGVWHVPPWRRLLRWRYKPPDPCPENELLNVQFAGVAIGQPDETESWLNKHLYGQWVWLTLINRIDSDSKLTCAVYSQKNTFSKKRCVNEQLLSVGLGSLDEVIGFKENKVYIDFIQQLGKSEFSAKRKGAGLWEGSEYIVWWRKLLRTLRIL